MRPQARIACVEDDGSVREALRGLLRSVGFDVMVFASAESFLQSADRSTFNCLIADVMLGGMSGIDLQENLASAGNRMPVIIITAVADDRLRLRAFKAGAVGFLRKPIAEQELLSTIELALSGKPEGEAST